MSVDVSIVIPLYNKENFIIDTLRSIRAQDFKNWECIMVDDGSKDNTLSVANEYCKRDRRFQYIFQENGGLSCARNTGIKLATGDLLYFLDSDDGIYPDAQVGYTCFLSFADRLGKC